MADAHENGYVENNNGRVTDNFNHLTSRLARESLVEVYMVLSVICAWFSSDN